MFSPYLLAIAIAVLLVILGVIVYAVGALIEEFTLVGPGPTYTLILVGVVMFILGFVVAVATGVWALFAVSLFGPSAFVPTI